MPILEIKNLTKYYGKNLAVSNLNLALKKGEIFGFVGPNGAGKSTTIRSIMNLINKTEGEILINGKSFTKEDIELKKLIGYLPSEIHLYDDLTVKEMLDYHERFYDNKNIKNKRKELVSILEINERKKVEDLSLGNLKKIGIVLAFMHEPKILILDEPTSGLDPIMQQTFYDLIKKEKEKGTTIFYSTHILNEITKICDRVGIIKEGNLLKIQTIKELDKDNFNIITIESKNIDNIIKELKIKKYKKEKDTIKFKNSLEINKIVNILNNYKIDKLLIEEASLEDIFLHYYK